MDTFNDFPKQLRVLILLWLGGNLTGCGIVTAGIFLSSRFILGLGVAVMIFTLLYVLITEVAIRGKADG